MVRLNGLMKLKGLASNVFSSLGHNTHFLRVTMPSIVGLRIMMRQAKFVDIYQEKFGFWVPVLATVGAKPPDTGAGGADND